MGLGAYNPGKFTGSGVTATSLNYNSLKNQVYTDADIQTLETGDVVVAPVDDVITFDEILYTEDDMLEATEVPKEEKKGILSSIGDFLASAGATVVVAGTSIVTGVANLGESIVDGVAWSGSKVVEGATWLTAETIGLVNDDAKEDIMNWREGAKENVQGFIATDWVGKANDAFYGTVGKGINEASAIKYDGEIAQKISKASEDVSKVLLATAVEAATGGIAGPVVVGFLSGTGSSAETNYKNGQTSLWDDAQIAMNGAFTSVSWIANAQIGKGLINVTDGLFKNGLKDLAKRTISAFTKFSTYKDAVKFTLDALLTAAKKPMSYVNTIFSIGSDIGAYITGDKELTAANVADTAKSAIGYFVIQALISKSNSYLKEQGQLTVASPEDAKNIAKDINNGNKSLKDVLDYNKEAQKQILSSMSSKEIADAMKNIKNSQVTKIYDLLNTEQQNSLINQIATDISTKQDLTLNDLLEYGNNFTSKIFSNLESNNSDLYRKLSESIGQDVVSGKTNINEVIKLEQRFIDGIKNSLPAEAQGDFVSKISAAKLTASASNFVSNNYETVGGIIDDDSKLDTIESLGDAIFGDDDDFIMDDLNIDIDGDNNGGGVSHIPNPSRV